ncbi:MBL fold metallo-hydrolase [Aureimonas altamirensis]|uniref:MBL fold metallo-hydrolase n=1 Tax=Aureimonas altamirensis TaxID=370622 RepID=UPI001E52C8DC|nr:MBL fold metallo-hydrolase [Aureimonas altamirensis]UHD44096.1 MBL fold metallo-hydrolase [Aureimonas altamirensis]
MSPSLISVRLTHSILALMLLSASGLLSSPFALAKAPMQKTQAPGFYRTMVGAFEITAISDGTARMPMDQLMSDPPEKIEEALRDAHLNAPMEMSVNAYLINTGDRLILVDTGSGAGLGPSLGKLATNIVVAGYKPDQIDDILLTHLHPDHVGGLTANGTAVFANAIVHASRLEAEFWLSSSNVAEGGNQAGFVKSVRASLDPYVRSSRFDPFDGDKEIMAAVRTMSAPGHTPGSVVYVIESETSKFFVVGDLIHAGAIQFARPDITFTFDSDQTKAAGARRTVFDKAVAERVLIGAAHLPFPGLGHIRAEAGAYRWLPLNYSTEFR